MMGLLMADQSIKRPVGILHDVLLKVDDFILSADFMILDYKIDVDVPIILGGRILATVRALVNVERGKLRFKVNEDEVMFNICQTLKLTKDL